MQKNYAILQGAYSERDRLMGTFKARYEEEAKKLAESERTVSSLEIQKKAMDKQSEIQRKQMLDKLNQLNLQITAEKDTREVWISRYEKE